MIIGTEEEVNVAEDNDSWHGVGLSQPQAGEGRSAVVLAEGYPGGFVGRRRTAGYPSPILSERPSCWTLTG